MLWIHQYRVSLRYYWLLFPTYEETSYHLSSSGNPTTSSQPVYPQHPRAQGYLPPSSLLDSHPPAPTSPHPPVIPPLPFQAITAQDAHSKGGIQGSQILNLFQGLSTLLPLPISSIDEFEEVDEARSIAEFFPDAVNQKLGELSKVIQSLVKPSMFYQADKPPKTVFQDTEFETDTLLSAQCLRPGQYDQNPWRNPIVKEFKCLEKLHLFSSEEKGESLENCPFHSDHGDFLVHIHHMNFVLSQYLKQFTNGMHMETPIFGLLILSNGNGKERRPLVMSNGN